MSKSKRVIMSIQQFEDAIREAFAAGEHRSGWIEGYNVPNMPDRDEYVAATTKKVVLR